MKAALFLTLLSLGAAPPATAALAGARSELTSTPTLREETRDVTLDVTGMT